MSAVGLPCMHQWVAVSERREFCTCCDQYRDRENLQLIHRDENDLGYFNAGTHPVKVYDAGGKEIGIVQPGQVFHVPRKSIADFIPNGPPDPSKRYEFPASYDPSAPPFQQLGKPSETLTEKWLSKLYYLSVSMVPELHAKEFGELLSVMKALRAQNQEMRAALEMLWKGGLEGTAPGTGPGTVHIMNSLRWSQVKKAVDSQEP